MIALPRSILPNLMVRVLNIHLPIEAAYYLKLFSRNRWRPFRDKSRSRKIDQSCSINCQGHRRSRMVFHRDASQEAAGCRRYKSGQDGSWYCKDRPPDKRCALLFFAPLLDWPWMLGSERQYRYGWPTDYIDGESTPHCGGSTHWLGTE